MWKLSRTDRYVSISIPNFHAEDKPDKLAHFCIDSHIRKLSRTNRYISTQNHFRGLSGQSPYSLNTNPLLGVKPDKLVRFRVKSFLRTQQGKPANSPLGVKPDKPAHSHRKTPVKP